MNEVYKELITEPFPVPTTVFVRLPPGAKVEVDALVVKQ